MNPEWLGGIFRIVLGVCLAGPLGGLPVILLHSSEAKSLFPYYSIQTWDTRDGLADNWVECVLRDKDRYVWLGTRRGLVRFDGDEFLQFNNSKIAAFKDDSIKAFVEDAEGDVWLATREGLLRFRETGFDYFLSEDGLLDDELTSLAAGQDGSLWIGSFDGVTRLSDGKFESFAFDSEGGAGVRSVLADSDQVVWAGALRGLYRLDAKEGVAKRIWPDQVPINAGERYHVRALTKDVAGTVWFGGDSGLFQVDKMGTAVAVSIGDNLSREAIEWLHEDASGVLWVATKSSLYSRENGAFRDVCAELKFSCRDIRNVTSDDEGNIWIASAYDGLIRLSPQAVRFLTTVDGLNHDDIHSISEGRDGRIWIGGTGGVNYYRGGRLHSLEDDFPSSRGLLLSQVSRSQKDTPLFRTSVRSIVEGPTGDLWLGTANDGLFHIRFEGINVKAFQHLTPSNEIQAIYEAGNGHILMGSRRGWTRLMPHWSEFYLFHVDDTVRDNFSDVLIFSPEQVSRHVYGTEWFNFREGGWDYYDEKTDRRHYFPGDSIRGRSDNEWLKFAVRDELPSYDITCFVVDDDEGLWIGTRAGLCLIEGEKVSIFSSEDGVNGKEVNTLVVDGEGVIWIGTELGLSCFRNGVFKHVPSRSGFSEREISSMLIDHRGILWTCGQDGIFGAKIEELRAAAYEGFEQVRSVAYDERDGMRRRVVNGGCQPSLFEANDGTIWVPTVKGISVFDPDRGRMELLSPQVVLESIHFSSDPSAQFGASIGMIELSRLQSPRYSAPESVIRLPSGSGGWL